MILSFGNVYESSLQDEILDGLEEKLNKVRLGPPLEREVVISALDRISGRIKEGEFDTLIAGLGMDNADIYKNEAAFLLSRKSIEDRIKTELGDEIKTYAIDSSRIPLGTIMHISAGNADVLPAYSLMEGLICGNINILKLPEADNGLTVMLLKMLTDGAPELAGYIHVFDTPSSDITAMLKMARMADAISVWGGDVAISAVRQMAPVGAEIIEWGHKLGFCYVSTDDISKHHKEFEDLAEHIMSTKQLLCSSCQVIYLDTESCEDIDSFCRFFLPILEQAAEGRKSADIGAAAEQTLRKRVREIDHILEEEDPEQKRYEGKGCSLIGCTDSELELSELWGNVPVKRLPKACMMDVLRRKKGYLQTAGLIADDNKAELAQLLIKCGINRVLPPGEMSDTFPCESHDGKYPFERFTRVVNQK